MKHPCIALLFAVAGLTGCSGGLSTSHEAPSTVPPTDSGSSTATAPFRAPTACRTRASGLFSLPDPRCTPGALNPDVTQSTIGRTICVRGWTKTIRPPESVTEPEKLALMKAYGDSGSPQGYELDHLASLELGGALNDSRNLWPEPGGSPNPKDRLENQLRKLVCSDQLSLADAQRAITVDWVAAYQRYMAR